MLPTTQPNLASVLLAEVLADYQAQTDALIVHLVDVS